MNIDKPQLYQQSLSEINSVLNDESLIHLKMATINSILKKNLAYYYWVGFYLVNNNMLSIGAYQGTMGCLHIPFHKGVCGRAARTGLTQIVDNTNDDPEHIACDAASLSEIALPVFNKQQQLIAVFDVDSLQVGSFDEVDKFYLNSILKTHFASQPLVYSYSFI